MLSSWAKRDSFATDPRKCIPIYPATENPLGRLPLHLTSPLPFPEGYQHTVYECSIAVNRIDPHNASDCYLRFSGKDSSDNNEDGEYDYWYYTVNDDCESPAVEPEGYEVPSLSRVSSIILNPPPLPLSVESGKIAVEREEDLEAHAGKDVAANGETEALMKDDESNVTYRTLAEAYGAHPLDRFEPPNKWEPLVDVMYDLSNVEEVSDPTNFMKEVMQIIECVPPTRDGSWSTLQYQPGLSLVRLSVSPYSRPRWLRQLIARLPLSDTFKCFTKLRSQRG